jgi:hypothetical protein
MKISAIPKSALLVSSSLAFLAAIPAQAALFDYTEGHAHFGLNYNVDPPDPRDRRDSTNLYPKLNPGGGLFPHVAAVDSTMNLHGEVAPGPYGPDQVTHIVPNTTYQARAANAGLDAALGNSGGDFMWILPEVQSVATAQNAPWTGPAVNGVAYGEFDDINDPDVGGVQDNVNWSLTAVSGPGEVALWVSDGFGGVGDIWMGSADGFTNDTITLGPGGRHNFMGFTEQGDYDVTFKWDVEVDGSALSESATFGFTVVPEPSAYAALIGLAALGLTCARRRARD